jgi:hypothetical protein
VEDLDIISQEIRNQIILGKDVNLNLLLINAGSTGSLPKL